MLASTVALADTESVASIQAPSLQPEKVRQDHSLRNIHHDRTTTTGNITLGRETIALVNYIRLKEFPTGKIYQYDVNVAPELPPPLYRLIWQLFEVRFQDSPELNGAIPVFDGRKNAYTSKPIRVDQDNCLKFTIEASIESGTHHHAIEGGTRGNYDPTHRSRAAYQLAFRFTKELYSSSLHSFLNGELLSSITTPHEMITFLDIIIRHKVADSFISVGRNLFQEENSRPMSGGMEVWLAGIPPIRWFLGEFRGQASWIHGRCPDQDSSAKKRCGKVREDASRAKDFNESPWPNKEIQITKLGDAPSIMTFKQDEGSSEISIQDYFTEHFGTKFINTGLPTIGALQHQCQETRLNEAQTREKIGFTCKPPDAHARQIMHGLSLFNYPENEYPTLGVRLSKNLERIPVRVLPPPTLEFGCGQKVHGDGSGTWLYRARQFYRPQEISLLGVVVFCEPRMLDIENLKAFMLVNWCCGH
ncbi:hypothetical protein BJ742DRAFT_781137 [Cladochytrium replicatum]|nr:hypothetical protein BJ742DRAFT_781137 [Cladochytrium replicatum]